MLANRWMLPFAEKTKSLHFITCNFHFIHLSNHRHNPHPTFRVKPVFLKRIIIYTFLVVLFACCKKTRQIDPQTATLVLNLRQSVLTIQQVDSADVVFRKVGTSQIIREKFLKKNEALTASLKALPPGTWNADVEVYTKAVNRQSHQYKIIKPVQVTGEMAAVEIEGPGATAGNGWLKRNVKASAGDEVVVIVPDEVYDSYFEFRSKTAHNYVYGIQREAINVNYVVAQETWICTTSCFDSQRRIVDSNHFMPFTQTILSSPWTRNEISISVLNDQQEMVLEYDRTWMQ